MANPYLDLHAELRQLRSKDVPYNKLATPRLLDFEFVPDVPDEPSGHVPHPPLARLDHDGNLMTPKLVRARLRKRRAKGDPSISPAEAELLYRKPISEWDTEELARGRPRNRDGEFSGPKPQWVTMDLHEEAIDRFSRVIKTEMGVATIKAMDQINSILTNEETDYRGKPLVSASTKLDAAKFMIEHLVGKPKQHIENDVSVKLQSILGAVIVNPNEDRGYSTGHMPGVTMELATREVSNEPSKYSQS